LSGVSTNAGGVGFQRPGPSGIVEGSHFSAEPSFFARSTARSPTARPSARPASMSLRKAAPATSRDSAASCARSSKRPGAASGDRRMLGREQWALRIDPGGRGDPLVRRRSRARVRQLGVPGRDRGIVHGGVIDGHEPVLRHAADRELVEDIPGQL
jgi:hypothetical protein